jgi:hypothetical protein
MLRRLPTEGFTFTYFKDRFALALLSYFVGEGRSVRDVKSSRYARLLENQTVKELTRMLPNGRLTADALDGIWSSDSHEFVLTFGTYGHDDSHRACQTSRAGMNFVLQVNFPDAHDRDLVRMLSPGNIDFTLQRDTDHPISEVRRTMAWVRIDIDFCSGEALIEEVQNDWIRTALARRALAETLINEVDGIVRFRQFTNGAQCVPRDFLYYTDRVLRPFGKIWSEATLAAAIWVLADVLGIKRIFYHTPASGAVLKDLDDAPLSLYTDLPRRFCFGEVYECPDFLACDMSAISDEQVAAASKRDAAKDRVAVAGRRTSQIPFYLLDMN